MRTPIIMARHELASALRRTSELYQHRFGPRPDKVDAVCEKLAVGRFVTLSTISGWTRFRFGDAGH